MASSKEYLDFVLEQLSELHDISCRAMMGEYIIYYRGKVVGGIYDNRFLVKNIKAAENLMPDAEPELPYDGAKEMLLVDNIKIKGFLKNSWKQCMMSFRHRKKEKQEENHAFIITNKEAKTAKTDKALLLELFARFVYNFNSCLFTLFFVLERTLRRML